MRVVRTVAELRDLVRAAERPVGLVPTMGFFHEGHLELMRRAREASATVVVSLFVNPTQFAAGEDLGSYPRDEGRDTQMAEAEGVDVLFAPSVEEVYPYGFATTIDVGAVATGMCADHRPGHFQGVATVVAKLFNMVQPDIAYFGQKDAQQAVVIQRMVRDLDMPVTVEVCPIVREDDGLAMSSRNHYLDAESRARAGALHRALRAAEGVVAAGTRDAATVLRAARGELEAAGIEPEYLELRSAEDLSPVDRVNGSTLLAVAARVGKARLIDNTVMKGVS